MGVGCPGGTASSDQSFSCMELAMSLRGFPVVDLLVITASSFCV